VYIEKLQALRYEEKLENCAAKIQTIYDTSKFLREKNKKIEWHNGITPDATLKKHTQKN